jgi:signal peptide peptidase SppA
MKLISAAIMAAFGCRSEAWALHPQALAVLAAVARGDLSLETVASETDVQAHVEAARGRGPQTTGGVAVLPLRGLITPRASFFSILFGGGAGLDSFRSQLREAVGDDDIAAIVLDVDSPGGSTDLLAETAAELRAAREVKPIVAVANTWAASAAYWLAAQADELVVTPTGEVGSVGVFTAHENWAKFEEEFGVETTLIAAGKYKTEGNRFEALSEDARNELQSIVDYYYELFASDVAKGRGASTAAVTGAAYGEGRMVRAKDAVGRGMADRVDTLEATIARVVKNPTRARRRAEESRSIAARAESELAALRRAQSSCAGCGAEIAGGAPAHGRVGDPRTHCEACGPLPEPTTKTSGTPEPNADADPAPAEEATARPSQAAIDVMFAPAR